MDGGNIYSVAMGHVYRCMRLADFISENEIGSVTFFMKDNPEAVGKVRERFAVEIVPKNLDTRQEAVFLSENIPEQALFICDVRGITNDYIAQVKRRSSIFCYIDDLGMTDLLPDFLVNPSVNASEILYRRDERCEYLLGLDYFVLDKSFVLRKEKLEKKARKILLTFGGADPMDIVHSFVRGMDESFRQYDLTCILGRAYGGKKEQAFLKTVRARRQDGFRISVHRDVESLSSFLFACDVALAAGGDTCLESIFIRTPTFIISSIYYEGVFGRYLDRNGAAFYAGSIEDDSVQDILCNVKKALNNRALLEKLFRNSGNVIDAKGTGRIVRKIMEKRQKTPIN